MDNIETISFSFTVNAVVAALLFYVFLPAVSAIITMEKFLSFLEIATTISQTVTQKKKKKIFEQNRIKKGGEIYVEYMYVISTLAGQMPHTRGVAD